MVLAGRVQELWCQGDEDAINRVAVPPLSNASLPLAPPWPCLERNLALRFVDALGLDLRHAFARYEVDHRIKSPGEIRDGFGVAVLGVIPADERPADRREIAGTGFSGVDATDALTGEVQVHEVLRTCVKFPNPQLLGVVVHHVPATGADTGHHGHCAETDCANDDEQPAAAPGKEPGAAAPTAEHP